MWLYYDQSSHCSVWFLCQNPVTILSQLVCLLHLNLPYGESCINLLMELCRYCMPSFLKFFFRDEKLMWRNKMTPCWMWFGMRLNLAWFLFCIPNRHNMSYKRKIWYISTLPTSWNQPLLKNGKLDQEFGLLCWSHEYECIDFFL